MRIRAATADDGPADVGLLRELGYDLDVRGACAFLARLLAYEAHTVLVAEEGVVVGFANANVRPQLHHLAPVCTIDELVVSEPARSRGVGAALLREVERIAHGRGCDSLELTCSLRREDAHRFYGREGFERTSLKLAKRPRAGGAPVAETDTAWRDSTGPIPNPRPPTGEVRIADGSARVCADFVPIL